MGHRCILRQHPLVTAVVALSVMNMQQYVVEVGLTELNEALPLVKEDSVWTRVDPVLTMSTGPTSVM